MREKVSLEPLNVDLNNQQPGARPSHRKNIGDGVELDSRFIFDAARLEGPRLSRAVDDYLSGAPTNCTLDNDHVAQLRTILPANLRTVLVGLQRKYRGIGKVQRKPERRCSNIGARIYNHRQNPAVQLLIIKPSKTHALRQMSQIILAAYENLLEGIQIAVICTENDGAYSPYRHPNLRAPKNTCQCDCGDGRAEQYGISGDTSNTMKNSPQHWSKLSIGGSIALRRRR